MPEITGPERADAVILAECDGVSRVFGRFTAVDGVDLAVGPGEVVGLLGANGAGKTTLIRMLLGLLPVSGGSVRLFGQPPRGRPGGGSGTCRKASVFTTT